MLSHDGVLNKHTWADWVIHTCDTAVGGHHQWMDPWVFDNVLPMDCVCMAQELVLVNIHTSTQDLCDKKRKHTIWSICLYLMLYTTDSLHRHSMFKSKSLSYLCKQWVFSFCFLFSSEKMIWGLTHLMMIVVERADTTKPCHIAIITTCALFPFCCFSHPSLHMSRADRINYASLLSEHKIHGGFQIQWGTATIISWWFYISSRWWRKKKESCISSS